MKKNKKSFDVPILFLIYKNPKITEAITKYLSEIRNVGDAVPSYPKCKNQDGYIIIADRDGAELSRHQVT